MSVTGSLIIPDGCRHSSSKGVLLLPGEVDAVCLQQPLQLRNPLLRLGTQQPLLVQPALRDHAQPTCRMQGAGRQQAGKARQHPWSGCGSLAKSGLVACWLVALVCVGRQLAQTKTSVLSAAASMVITAPAPLPDSPCPSLERGDADHEVGVALGHLAQQVIAGPQLALQHRPRAGGGGGGT